MKFIADNKGIALVTSLMLTLITLVISMVTLYLVLQNIKGVGGYRQYKNSLDAAMGGVDIVAAEALPNIHELVNNGLTGTALLSALGTSMPNMHFESVGVSDACLKEKLLGSTWTSCPSTSTTSEAKSSPDLVFTLQSQLSGFTAPTGYRVYTKIVSTIKGSSGRDQLDGHSTTEAPSGDVGSPYIYRIEVTSEKISNPRERANLSVLYAY